VEEIKVLLKFDKKTRSFHEDVYKRFIILRNVLFGEWNVSDKKVTENIKTHFLSNNFFFFVNPVVYEIMWENATDPDRTQMTI
jgi:hypothetical protein